MPEIKQNFSSGKMNQDLDERIVPAGEYRYALNAEISTSEDSDIGSLQTLKGNINTTSGMSHPSGSSCVGSIADEKNNKVYSLLSGEKDISLGVGGHFADYIVEYDTDTQTTKPVLVDVYQTKKSLPHTGGAGMRFFYIDGDNSNLNITNVRPGMLITGTFNGMTGGSVTFTAADKLYVDKMIYVPVMGYWSVYFEDRSNNPTPITEIEFSTGDEITFTADRILNFEHRRFVTGINIIDSMLFWTDGITEPKKVSIERSLRGTTSIDVHTFFHVYDDYDLEIRYPSSLPHSTLSFDNKPSPIETRDVTVIKQSPLHPPRIIMSSITDGRFDANGNQSIILGTTSPMTFFDVNERNVEVNDVRSIFFDGSIPNYKPGDTIILTNDDAADIYF